MIAFLKRPISFNPSIVERHKCSTQQGKYLSDNGAMSYWAKEPTQLIYELQGQWL